VPLRVPLCRSLLLRALTRLRTSAGWKKDFQMLLENPDPVHTLEAAPAAAPRALFMTACLQHEERTTAGWTGLKQGETDRRGVQGAHLNPLGFFLNPLGLFLRTSIPFYGVF
jgi:hypothetical protein